MNLQTVDRKRLIWFSTAILAAALVWKAILLLLDTIPFNADEAVVALMARHILQGERPIFFYGQVYMGSLDAFFVAAGFFLFGQQVWVIRLVQALLYCGLIITTILLGRAAFGTWMVGILAAVLMAVPTVNVTLYTTASLGGYGEAMLLGNLVLLVTIQIIHKVQQDPTSQSLWCSYLIWGALSGIGMWANGLSLVYSAPAGVILLVFHWKAQKNAISVRWKAWFPAAFIGFMVGSAPWWIFAVSNGFDHLVLELLGSAVAVEQTSWLVRTWDHLVSFILLGGTVMFGFRPPWDIRWLGLPLLPFVLIFWAYAIVHWFRKSTHIDAQRWGWLLINASMAALTAGFILTSFGVDPSGRYFLPFVVPISMAAALAIIQSRLKTIWKASLVGMLLVYQGWGTLESAFQNPPGITTQFSVITRVDTRFQTQLIDFLKAQGETRGYSNYWVAYPTAFLSNEELIFLPRLPYHDDMRYTLRDDRYSPYQELLASATRAAYITTRNAALDQKLVDGFTKLGIGWQENRIGDYHIFYRLTRLVRPDELDLGIQP